MMATDGRPVLALAAAVLALGAPAALAQTGGFDRYDGYGHMNWGSGWGMVGGGMMLIFWIAIIVLVVAAVRWLWQSGPSTGGAAPDGGSGTTADPLEVLKDRLARGEIDVKDFEERRKALGG